MAVGKEQRESCGAVASIDRYPTAVRIDDLFDDGGFEMREMHLSALAYNTRITHAQRHGHVYTTEQQREWWEKDGNRISCQCSTASVLADKKTGEILQKNLVAMTKKSGKEFFAEKVI